MGGMDGPALIAWVSLNCPDRSSQVPRGDRPEHGIQLTLDNYPPAPEQSLQYAHRHRYPSFSSHLYFWPDSGLPFRNLFIVVERLFVDNSHSLFVRPGRRRRLRMVTAMKRFQSGLGQNWGGQRKYHIGFHEKVGSEIFLWKTDSRQQVKALRKGSRVQPEPNQRNQSSTMTRRASFS